MEELEDCQEMLESEAWEVQVARVEAVVPHAFALVPRVPAKMGRLDLLHR